MKWGDIFVLDACYFMKFTFFSVIPKVTIITSWTITTIIVAFSMTRVLKNLTFINSKVDSGKF